MKRGLLLCLVAAPLMAFPTGAPAGHTAAPGEPACNACHRSFPLNPEGGFVRVETVNYKPGQRQTLRITVSHPESRRWGFQIAARWAKDPTQNVGTFRAPSSDVQVIADGAYMTHTLAGTRSNAGAGQKTFEVEWTAPDGADDSDVIFFAAGNAANDNATGAGTGSSGDRIYTTQTRIQVDTQCAFTERPVITDVIDGASFNLGASAGGIVTIKGRNFASANARRDATQGYVRNDNFPKELGCLAVEIGGQRAPILYANEQQINVQVPALTELGDVPVRAIMNPDRSNALNSDPATLTLKRAAPAFFTFNGRSVAARVAGSALIVAEPAVVPGARPARPGEVIELYGTGLGPTNPAVAPGALAPNAAVPTATKPVVTIGGTQLADADVLYSGLAPGNVSGLNQINVRVPSSASNGDILIQISVGGDTSVAGTTIPVRAQ